MLAASSVASAQVLTFDEMAPDPLQSTILGSVVCSASTGFRFSSDHFHVIGPNFSSPFSSSGSTHLGFESGRGFPVTMERQGTGTFTLASLDAGEFYEAHNPEAPDAEWITLTGVQADGTIVTHSIFLDGIRDGVGGVPDFEHFVLPNTFVNLRSVVFTGWRTGGIAGGLAFDNVEYLFDEPDPVPPCTFHLLQSDVPSVSFVSPSSGVVSGIVAIEANASDNVGVESVVFRLDGVELAAPDQTAPYTLQWDTTLVADGAYLLTAEARDADDNVGTATISVTVQNVPTGGAGPHYIALDGINDAASAIDAPALSFGNGTTDTPFTIEMWMRPDLVSGQHLLLSKAGEYRLAVVYGSILAELQDASTGARATVVTNGLNPAAMIGAWHHLAVTYDGRGGATAANGITLYLDGAPLSVFRGTDASYVAMENLTAPLEIGLESEVGRQYDGALDELRFWGVLRSAAEIQGAMAIELVGTEPGLAGYWRFNEGAGTVADDSAGASPLLLTGGTSWVAGGPLAPDIVAPQISNVTVTNVTYSSATISFTTDEATTGWVSYATSPAGPFVDVFSAAIGTSHSITLTGLNSDTVYHFEVRASDAADNEQVNAPFTFQTLIAPVDFQPPTVTIVTPSAGTVAGVISLEATATDNVSVVDVIFRLDGVALGAADSTAPYAREWDTTSVANGSYVITAEARDPSGNVGSASVTVTVQNNPGGPHYIQLDGVDDAASASDAPALSFGNGTTDRPMTVELWMRPDRVDAQHALVSKEGEYRIALIYGSIMAELDDPSSTGRSKIVTNGLNLLPGAWHHVVFTYDGRGGSNASDGMTLYLDGAVVPVFRGTDENYVSMEDLGQPLEIGREVAMGRQYQGGIDELRLWNVVRSAAEIQATMNTELVGTEADLAAYWRFNAATGTSVPDDSPGNATLTLLNGTAWVPGGPLGPDNTAPTISGVATSNLTSSSVTISFATNEPTTGWVSYATNPAGPFVDVFSAAIGMTHSVTLTGLSADTLYHYEVRARDAANNVQVVAPLTFQTPAAPVDFEPPTVAFVTPAAGTVLGVITLEATATDNIGVVDVVFRVDGVALGTADSTAPYSREWDTTSVANGSYVLTAEARDASSNVATASVTVTVQNNPGGPHYVELDGVNDAASAGDAPALSFGNGTTDTPLSIELWLQPDVASGQHGLVNKAGEYRVAVVYGSIVAQLEDASSGGLATVVTNGGVNLNTMVGEWHHLAVTYDGRGGSNAANGMTVYLDGVSVPLFRVTDAGYVAMENLAAPLQIGREGELELQYDGGLDELRLWNVLRSAAEIQATMTTELVGTEPGLAAYWRFNTGFGTAVADDSPGSATVTLLNGTAWVPGGPLVPDTTAPIISGIATSNLTSSSVTISFATDEPTTGWIAYATNPAGPFVDVFSAAIGTTHSITLTGLSADTLYHYEVRARDAANNVQVVAPLTFQTLAAPVDLQAPTVAFVTPAAGTVLGVVTLEATATDNIGVVDVVFRVDGVALGTADSTLPYAVEWDTTLVVNGSYVLTAEARDAAGNVGTASVTVTVQNNPGGPHYLDFDGVNDAARAADAAALSFGNGTTDTPLSIELWLRPDVAGSQHGLVNKAGEYRVALVYGSIIAQLEDASTGGFATVVTNGSVNLGTMLGEWHHVAVTYDGRGGSNAADGITIYLDGVAVPVFRGTDASYVAMENLAAPLEIGREGELQYDGGLDELRLWNVLRTAAEIQATMAAELVGTEPGLAAYWRFNAGTGTAAADDSPGTATVSLLNGTAWVAGGPINVDTTAPIISGIATSNLTSSSVTISFTTDEATTGWIAYATNPAGPFTNVFSAAVGTAHSIALTGLNASTEYHYEVRATDAANNLQVVAPLTFQTLAPPADVQPPTVTFVTPAAGTVSGIVTLEATATDNVGVTNVVFKLDGVDLAPPDAAAPYTLQWDTTLLADGAYVLSAEARDAADNVGTATVAVTVQNLGAAGPYYIALDGIDDAARANDAAALSFGDGTTDTPLSIELWMQPDVVSGQHALVTKAGEYRVAVIAGSIIAELRDASTGGVATLSTNGVNLAALVGEWHHLAVTYDGRGGADAANGLTLYLDGVAVPVFRGTDASYVAMENLAAPLEIGRDGELTRQYDGGLDELRLWNVLRTPAEIQATMATELLGTEPGLAGYWRFNAGSGNAAADDSTGTATMSLLNGTAWVAGGPLTPDTTAPIISGIATSNLTSSSVTISFATDEPTTGWIAYSTSPAGPFTNVFSAAIGTAHSIALTGLTASTEYHYEVRATDAANNLQVVAPLTFQTLAPPADVQPPAVSFVTPAAGTVSGIVTLEATATDNVAVADVVFKLDGVDLAPPDATAPYTLQWDTTLLPNGAYVLSAEARDAANNVGTATVAVTVQNVSNAGAYYLDFDGVNDAASANDAAALSFGNGTIDTPLSIELWMQPGVVTGQHALVTKAGEYRVALVAGSIIVELRDASTGGVATLSTNGVNLAALVGEWHHLAVTYDGRGGADAANGLTLYLDGVVLPVFRGTDASYLAMENLASPLEIGREAELSQQYQGGLDELRLWSTLRTPAEIQATMATELTGAEAGLAGYWRFNAGTGNAAADDSAGTATMSLLNGTVWVAGGPLTPDTTAPIISGIATSNLTSSSVTISFTTDEPTTGWIAYSTSPAGPFTNVFSAGVGTAHSVTLTGLTASTEYHYEVRATDAANNLQVVAPLTFQTLAPPADVQPPTVTFVTPAAGTVLGVVTLEATATDNVGVTNVVFKLDGVDLAPPDATAPYTLQWDTTLLADGAYVLSAEARDAANNVGTATVAVTVLNNTGAAPQYVDLDGVDDAARASDAPALSFGNGTTDTPLTIETWLRLDTVAGQQSLVSKAGEYRVAVIAGSIMVELRDASTGGLATLTTNGVDLGALVGQWHHLAVTYDGRGGSDAANGITLYLDGVAVPVFRGTDASYVAMEDLTAPLEIGRDGELSRQYDGGLDELRMWNVLRTAAELQAAMAAELTGAEAGLAGYWRFNAGSGNAVVDDSSGTATLLLLNGTAWVAGGPFEN